MTRIRIHTVWGYIPVILCLVMLFSECMAKEDTELQEKAQPPSSSTMPTTASQHPDVLHPVQLVRPSKDHTKLELMQEGLEYLRSITQSVALVVAVGPYHTGKSFLLNALISLWRATIKNAPTTDTPDTAARQSFNTTGIALFEVAKEVAPTTMGLWLLKTDIVLPDGSVVLFMDSEGFYGQDVSEDYDARIFTVATLLSSHLLYTSVKLIDQNAVEYLEILARRTQLFQIKNIIRTSGQERSCASTTNNAATENKQLPPNVEAGRKGDCPLVPASTANGNTYSLLQYNDFPPFSWIVKDFAQDLGGLTPNDWLHQYIHGHRDHTAKTRETNLFSVFTRGIDCHTLFLPATEMDQLKQLGRIDMNTQLTAKFVQDLAGLQRSIAASLKVKTLNGQLITGHGLGMLTSFVIHYINRDTFPPIPHLWNNWIVDVAATAYKDIQEYYENEMAAALQEETPLNSTELQRYHDETLLKSIEYYKSMLFNVFSLYGDGLEPLQKNLAGHYTQIVLRNSRRIKQYMEEQVAHFCTRIAADAAALNVPRDPSTIAMAQEKALGDWTVQFVVRFARYEDIDVFKDEKTKLETFIKDAYTGIGIENDKYITSLLHSTRLQCRDVFYKKFQDQTLAKPRTLEHLQATRRDAAAACDNAIHEYISHQMTGQTTASMPKSARWIEKTSAYAAFLIDVASTKDSVYNEFYKKNEDMIENMTKNHVDTAKKKIRDECKNIEPMPDELDVIKRKISIINERYLNEYEQDMKIYRPSPHIDRHLESLKQNMLDIGHSTIDRTIQTVKAHSYDVFQCALARLAQSQCTWCFENFITYLYDRKARLAAQACFADDTIAKKFSPELRERVISDWVAQDISSERNNILFNMLMVLVAVIVVAVTSAYLLMRRRRTRSAPKHPHIVNGHNNRGYRGQNA